MKKNIVILISAQGPYHQKSQNKLPQVKQPLMFFDTASLNQKSLSEYKESGLLQ